ncbi:DUF4249 domain-containing protein [Pedobacter sp. MC2016-24]|uniref:DUF4249 domain-containing protein n=1 Tax=Pedobacter sp. MC2016-24 TaxID=2780090 RepID=UPI001D164FDC|nr:DUF4249 domain-containing protein [Pedobacter sp. MC2016-24]
MSFLYRMMNFRIYTLLAFMVLLASGCEKVIDLKLDNADAALVIEGGVTDQNEAQIVKISRTYSFTEPNKFNGVTGAKITLTRPNGVVMNYTEVSPGKYQTSRFRGIPGTKYILDVNVDGKSYSATSIMPLKVALDSISFKQFDFFGKSNTYAAVNYIDPPGIQNQYRMTLTYKGKVEADMAEEDRFNDGNNVANVIFYKLNDLITGDSVLVDFQCIDRNVFKYFYSLGQNSGEGGPPVAPANPPSNFSNGALGIFSAYTTEKKTAVIRKLP